MEKVVVIFDSENWPLSATLQSQLTDINVTAYLLEDLLNAVAEVLIHIVFGRNVFLVTGYEGMGYKLAKYLKLIFRKRLEVVFVTFVIDDYAREKMEALTKHIFLVPLAMAKLIELIVALCRE